MGLMVVTVSEVIVAGVSVSVVRSSVLGRNLGMRSNSIVRLEGVLMRVQRIGVRVRVRGVDRRGIHVVRRRFVEGRRAEIPNSTLLR